MGSGDIRKYTFVQTEHSLCVMGPSRHENTERQPKDTVSCRQITFLEWTNVTFSIMLPVLWFLLFCFSYTYRLLAFAKSIKIK